MSRSPPYLFFSVIFPFSFFLFLNQIVNIIPLSHTLINVRRRLILFSLACFSVSLFWVRTYVLKIKQKADLLTKGRPWKNSPFLFFDLWFGECLYYTFYIEKRTPFSEKVSLLLVRVLSALIIWHYKFFCNAGLRLYSFDVPCDPWQKRISKARFAGKTDFFDKL